MSSSSSDESIQDGKPPSANTRSRTARRESRDANRKGLWKSTLVGTCTLEKGRITTLEKGRAAADEPACRRRLGARTFPHEGRADSANRCLSGMRLSEEEIASTSSIQEFRGQAFCFESSIEDRSSSVPTLFQSDDTLPADQPGTSSPMQNSSHGSSRNDEVSGYCFQAKQETPPDDSCRYRDHFSPSLNESADDYMRHRDAVLRRRRENDLLLGTLGLLNVNDGYSVNDLIEFSENVLASHGVERVLTSTTDGQITITTEGDVEEAVTITREEIEELTSDEVLIVNGNVAARVEPTVGDQAHDIPPYSPGHGANSRSCHLCQRGDVQYQFSSRYGDQNLRHLLHNGVIPNFGRPEGGTWYEDQFSIDSTLQRSSYGREYNFLPTSFDLLGAVEAVRHDDTPLPAARISAQRLISLCFGDVYASSLRKLLVKYYIMKNCRYDVKGATIRNVNFCE